MTKQLSHVKTFSYYHAAKWDICKYLYLARMSLEKKNSLSRAENKFNELSDDSFSFPLPLSANSWSSQSWILLLPWGLSHPNVCILSIHLKLVNNLCCSLVLLNLSGNLLQLRHISITKALEMHAFSSLGCIHTKFCIFLLPDYWKFLKTEIKAEVEYFQLHRRWRIHFI